MKRIGTGPGLLALSLLLSCERQQEQSRTLKVATASNVQNVLKQLSDAYAREQKVRFEISAASSGQLDSQIRAGAPFDAYFSADAERPRKLEHDGLSAPGTRFTYAFGRLALVGSALEEPDDAMDLLRRGDFKRFAIANPDTAPYGAAAVQVLKKLGLWDAVEPKLVRGENVTQAMQFIDTGSAELGIVALSTVIHRPGVKYWLVPKDLFNPIRQEALILGSSHDLVDARAFFQFLRGDTARRLLVAAGYEVP